MAILSKQALVVENNSSFPDNSTGAITATGLRNFNTDIIDSMVDELTFTPFSASVLNSISNLNTFTASQQPSFNALNSFTASQLTINTGINSFTQSTNGRLNSLQAYTASYTSSISVYDEAVLVNGNVNAIAFSGNGVSASFVSNKAVVNVDFTPLNQFSASTSQSLYQLQDNFNTFTASTDNSIALIEIVTASYATTGSNTFTQNQYFEKSINVTGSVYVGTNIYVNGGIEATYIKTIYETSSVIYSSGSNQFGDALTDNQILSGSTYVEGQLYVNKLNVTDQFALINSFTASQLVVNSGYNTFTASTQSDLTAVHQTTQSLNQATQSLQSQLTTIGTQSGSWITESETGSFAITGSNIFNGTQTILGNLYVSSSNTADVVVEGQLFISSSTSGSANGAKLTISGAAAIGSSGNRTSQVVIVPNSVTLSRAGTTGPTSVGFNSNGAITTSGPTSFVTANVNTGSNAATIGTVFNDDPILVYNAMQIATDANGSYLQDWDNTLSDYSPFMYIAPNDGETIPIPQFTRGLSISGSGLQITGSVYGNVISQSIVSSTASIDLSKANFYTVALPSTTSTRLDITNLGKGQTAMIQITSNTQASASFSSNVKQPSGFAYLPSTGSGAIDVLTLASFDGTNVLVTNVTNLL
jgi:hypothetical protein